MVDDVNANIGVNIDTSSAIASLKNLQREISLFHTQMARGGATANAQAAQLQSSLLNAVNATGQFQASMTRVNSTTEAFTTALEKNKLTMGQYFRYAGGASKTFGRAFKSEFDTISKVAVERVKDLQTQYISMGRDANGALQSIKIRPLSLDMDNLATRTMVAAQKQQLFNQLLTQGSTNLLNFGKNTQWAGRQLMVGFTIPLTLFATSAAKSFMEIEKQVIRIRRVYGDFNTTVKETDDMIASIKTLAGEYTKYGIEVEKTIGLASEAAAAGKTGQELLAQVSQATRLAVLGNVEQSQALETTMSITNAFGTATEQLASKIDFLNAVENQSVTSIEDLTEAIPKAGPVVQQLGGDVEDLAFFLTAMKEGGINASEGANALKSGLAALINPTGKAKEMLQGFGINIEKIVESNKGDIKGLVIDFASALDTLDPLNRARAIEQLFGKFQFSRLSTLFQNVIGEGTQASRVLELTKATTQELAILSQRELKKVEDTTTYKFEKAFADFQAALAPVGESFLKAVTPVIEFGTKLLNQFNSMGDGAKNFTVILTTVVAGIGPVLLMTVGLVANGVANLIKMFQLLGGIFKKTGVDTGILGTQTDYMTQQQIEAAAVAASLNQSHSKLTQTFSVEAAALNSLTAAYQRSITAQRGFGGGGTTTRSSRTPKKYANGVVSVPGPKGKGDVVPAMLSPGEAVIPAAMAKKYGGLIDGMVSGSIPGYQTGLNASTSGLIASHGSDKIQLTPEQLKAFAQQNLTPDKRAYKEFMSAKSSRNLYSNLVFGMPAEFNMGKMSGEKAGNFIKGNTEAFGSYLSSIEKIDSKSPAFKDFGARVAQQLAKSGTKAIDDPTFYRIIATEIEKTKDKELKSALERARTTYATGDIEKSSKPGRFHREPLAGAGPSYASSSRRNAIRVKYNPAVDEFYGTTTPQTGTQILTPAQKRQQTIARNKQIKIQQDQEAKSIRDANNQRRRERYAEQRAAAQAAAQPAPKKPGLGSRIASGIKGTARAVGPMGGMMAMGAVGGGLSMIPGMEALGAAVGIVGPLMMMLPGPIKLVVLALTGMVGILMAVNAAQQKQRESAIALGNAQVMNLNSLNKMAEDMGTVSATQSREAEMSAKLTSVKAEEMSAGQQYIRETESGKNLLSNTKTMQDSGKSVEQIATSLASDLANSVAQNVITQEQGREIIAALGVESGNLGISSAASKQFTEYTRDLTKTTSMVTTDTLAMSQDIFNQGMQQNSNRSGGFNRFAQDLNEMRLALNVFGNMGTIDTFGGADRNAVRQASTMAINNYGQAVGGTDAINAEYDKKVAEAAPGEIKDIESQRTADLDKQRVIANDIFKQVKETKVALGDWDFNDNFMTNIEKNFAEGSPMRVTAQKVKDLAESDFKTRIQTQLTSGTLSPASVEVLLANASKDKEFGSTYSLLIETIGEVSTLNLVASLQSAGFTPIRQSIIMDIVNKSGNQQFADIMSMAAVGGEGINVQATINYISKNEDKVLEAWNSWEGMSDEEKTVRLQFETNGFKLTAEQWNEYAALPDYQQKVFEEVFQTTMVETKAKFTVSGVFNLKAYEEAMKKLNAYNNAMTSARSTSAPITGGDVGNENGSGGGGGTTEDAELVRLNDLKDKQQKALNVIALKEDAINKVYDKRKKALEDIAKLNQKIAENQKSQLTIAEALSSGDISAAARAVQDARAKASQYAEEQQMQALDKKRQMELDGIIVNGKTKEAYEAEIAKLNLQIAERELALANGAATSSGGSGSSGGSSGSTGTNTANTTTTTTTTTTPTRTVNPAYTIAAANRKKLEDQVKSFEAQIATLQKNIEQAKRDFRENKISAGVKDARIQNANKQISSIAYSKSLTAQALSKLYIPPVYLASGGMAKYLANGGPIGSDTIPAMLTPGEFVVKRPAVQSFGVKNLEAINSGKSLNGSVYNYSVTVNASTGANADEIARTVISRIKQVDGQKLRGNRY
jgi:TP901 family phage tail tape measure protein